MNSVYFGDSATRLYGVYHAAKGQTPRESGIVLCYPMGQEYMRSHRAYRMLSLMLAKRGYHVFRFDYFATGDSAGESGDGSLTQWGRDIGAAIEELKETADLERVSLIGLRLGAALALEAAAGRDDIERLVLWDPVVDGERYVEQLMLAVERDDGSDITDARAVLDRDALVGVLGFPLTQSLATDLNRINVKAVSGRPLALPRMHMVVSEEDPGYLLLREALETVHSGLEYCCIPAAGRWNEVDNFGSALVPQEIIQDIVGWMEAR